MNQQESSKKTIFIGVLLGLVVILSGSLAFFYSALIDQPQKVAAPCPSPVSIVEKNTEQPSEKEIISWLADDKTYNLTGAEVSDITPIKLTNGEQAYLASVYLPNADTVEPRVEEYVLARPFLKKAKIVDGYGAQRTEPIQNVGDYETGSVLIVGNGRTATRTSESYLYIVKFDGWNVKELHSAEMGDGCDADNSEEICGGNKTFLNSLGVSEDGKEIRFVETTVDESLKPDSGKIESTVKSKILTLTLNAQTKSPNQ